MMFIVSITLKHAYYQLYSKKTSVNKIKDYDDNELPALEFSAPGRLVSLSWRPSQVKSTAVTILFSPLFF